MKDKVEEKIIAAISPIVDKYLSNCFKKNIHSGRNGIVVSGKYDKADISEFNLLRVLVSDDGEEIHIQTIFTPEFLKGKGIGRKLITAIYEAIQEFNSRLYLVDLTPWSFKYFVEQEAIQTDDESVQITEAYINFET